MVALAELANDKKEFLDSGQSAEKHVTRDQNNKIPSSIIDSVSEDCDDDVKDKTYMSENDSDERNVSASSSVHVTEFSNHRNYLSPNKSVPLSPKARNSGKAYEIHTLSKNIQDERAIKLPCNET
ncbi:hypothetical protein PR048_022952 [Dryococelus australis]|uniref:Uncharacterized protein n=1 Tax=Dryococelus australis TaxID=614101 RepID=A0ABQ9GSS0_9NEOP|nr:hypothetical protein PR048_022952 [Dryococelus australis]